MVILKEKPMHELVWIGLGYATSIYVRLSQAMSDAGLNYVKYVFVQLGQVVHA